LALDCLDNEAVAAGVLIFNDSHWAFNALKESRHSSHSILAPLRARLRGLKGCVCFQWVPAHCGLFENKWADEEATKAAGLGPDDNVQRGRISFKMYGDGPFRCLHGASRRGKVLLAQLRGSHSLLLGETQKRVQGTDSMCPCCVREEEDLEHVLRTCPKLESPKRRNFVQNLLPLLVMTTDQEDLARYFREVFDWDLPRPSSP
jgi:hypothetical protein